jgi:predicted outer membrane repeat protein
MHQLFTASFIRKNFTLFIMAILVAGLALSVLPVSHAADITITTLIDENGTCATGNGCSLREAIAEATTDQEIDFSVPVPGTIILTNGELTINKNLTITGPGADSLTISGNDASRIINISSGKAVTITGVTIQDGKVSNDTGGGILSAGTLWLDNCTVSNNAVDGDEGQGGGIYSKDTLTLNNSTVSGNTASIGGGIVIDSGANTTAINNSTVNGNTAVLAGGGIVVYHGASPATINNSTISGNTAGDGDGGGIVTGAELTLNNCTVYTNTAGATGGIWVYELTTFVKNTIIAGNTGGTDGNCHTVEGGGAITSQGYNLESGTDCGFTETSDLQNTDADLRPLQDNGGSTWTHALFFLSPAVNRIPYTTNGCGTDYITDQRGYGRPESAGGDCDIGAYEHNAVAPTATPTNTPTLTATPTNTPTPTTTPTPVPTNTPIVVNCDVTELINDINTANGPGGADFLNLAADCTYTLTTTNNPTDGPNGLPSITSEIAISGKGATIERSSEGGTPQFRIFHVASGGALTLSDMTVANGDAGSYHGGGIFSKGALNISYSTLSGNTGGFGGAIYNSGGTLDISNSTLSGNTGSFGGGVFNGGTLNVSSSTFSGNTATTSGGGIYGGADNIKNTILANNTPSDCDGTMTSQGYNLIENTSDCTISGDTTGNIIGQDPNLDTLLDNGGPTWTHALLEGSPAIDHIPYETNGCGTDYTTDQRGYYRPYPPESGCDIGAYEYGTIFADVNGDCVVNIEDVMLVADSWRCQSGDECYDRRYDLDHDGGIDIVDIMLVAAHWEDAC